MTVTVVITWLARGLIICKSRPLNFLLYFGLLWTLNLEDIHNLWYTRLVRSFFAVNSEGVQQLEESMTTIQASEDATEANKRGRVSSNSPPMNNKKQKDADNCVTCSEPTVEDALQCVWCERWEHSKCVKISADQYLVLSDISSNIVFFCSQCLFKLPNALMTFGKSNETCSFLRVS